MSHGMPLSSAIDLMAVVMGAKDEAEFSSRFGAATKRCGFEMFLVGLEVRGPGNTFAHHVTSAYPVAWQQIYAQRNYVAQDPTVAYCQTHTDPAIWSEQIFGDADALPLWEEARSHGVGFGISVPTHERVGAKSMVSLVRDKPWGTDPREKTELMAMAQVLSCCAHTTITRLIAPKLKESLLPSLTGQETTCLRWVAQGKTSWEIGQIMNIATPTVVFHLKNVMKKLDVVNRAQALAMAIRFGLID